jgi:hypothetical protein
VEAEIHEISLAIANIESLFIFTLKRYIDMYDADDDDGLSREKVCKNIEKKRDKVPVEEFESSEESNRDELPIE